MPVIIQSQYFESNGTLHNLQKFIIIICKTKIRVRWIKKKIFAEILAYIIVPAEAQLAAVITPNNRSSIFIARKDEKLVLQCTANVDGEPRRVKSVKWFDESGTELNYEFGRLICQIFFFFWTFEKKLKKI